MESAREWSKEEFGGARLGDARRTRRLQQLAAKVAQRPAGRVTQVCQGLAEREGAFRFLENRHIDAGEIGRSHHRCTARRCRTSRFVYVAMDMVHLAVTDRCQDKGLGVVGKGQNPHLSGMSALNAWAVTPEGVPLGLLSQRWWCRFPPKTPLPRVDRRPREERETWHWHEAKVEAQRCLMKHGGQASAWFVADRGADIGWFLHEAVQESSRVTIRSAYNRRLSGPRQRYVHSVVRRGRIRGTLQIQPPQQKKAVTLNVRAKSVVIQWTPKSGATPVPVPMNIVHVRQHGRPRAKRSHQKRNFHPRFHPHRPKRIEWFLLTTAPIDSWEEILEVIHSYTQRWKVEEFHKTLKTGACHAESSQLRSRGALQRWWVILSAVAARIERLKHLGRNQPQLLASELFQPHEINAVILLADKHPFSVGDIPTMGQMMALVAKLGGYVPSNKHPPGSITLRRGLEQIAPAARVLEMQENQKRCD